MLSLHQQLFSQAMQRQLYLNSKPHLRLNNSLHCYKSDKCSITEALPRVGQAYVNLRRIAVTCTRYTSAQQYELQHKWFVAFINQHLQV